MGKIFENKEEEDREKVTLKNVISILLIKLGGEVVITPEDQEKLINYAGHSVEQVTKKEPHTYVLSLINKAEQEEVVNEHLRKIH